MARFGLLMLNKGNWNGTQILTDTSYFNDLITPSQSLNNSYGYLWWLNGQSSFILPGSQVVFPGKLFPNAPDDAYAALGKDNQLLVVVPSRKFVFVRMGKSGSSNLVGPQMVDEIWQILDKLICAPTAVKNIDNDNDIEIYPNPASRYVEVQSTADVKSIDIYNSIGTLLLRTSDAKIEVSNYSSGVYYMRLVTKQGISTHRFIKQ